MAIEKRVVVVTGGTGYLGSAVCRAFAGAGAAVVAVYLLDRELPYFRKKLGRRAREVSLIKANLTGPGEMERVARDVVTRSRRIDVLVNTVGGYMSGSVEATTDEEFDRAIALNLKSTFLACRAVIPAMRKAKRGKIVNVDRKSVV